MTRAGAIVPAAASLALGAAIVGAAASLALGAAAWHWRTGAVGGSDSSCYALMAKAYAEGRVEPASALALEAPWPEPSRVAAPGGFLPSPTQPGGAVPVCAPGYGLLVAPLVRLFGAAAIHALPPMAAAWVAWAAFLIARRLAGPWAGVAASLLVACHPIVLFQAVQPMNDITTAAIWTTVALMLVAGRPWAVGALVGIGLLVRPNLALAGAAAIVAVGLVASRRPGPDAWGRAVRAGVVAALAAVPGVAAALVLNRTLYGSPFTSGYGQLDTLFSASYVAGNVQRYGRTWLATSTPLVLLAAAAPWALSGRRRQDAWMLIALASALAAVYLAYRPFPEWWYLRFFLPAVVLSLVLASAAVAALAARVPWRAGAVAAVLVVVAAAAWGVTSPPAAEAFGLRRLESRFTLTAETVAMRLPAEAVIVTVWPSGAIRYASGHEVVMWDALDPAWLDRALAWLAATGRPPALVLEDWEEPAFRARFAGQVFGALDWPPRVDIDRRVRLYLPDDRARYLAGEPVPTSHVFGPRARR
ncbi:MAG: hypothetical protein R2745_16315 [Vicinamibacterales bacterium]